MSRFMAHGVKRLYHENRGCVRHAPFPGGTGSI